MTTAGRRNRDFLRHLSRVCLMGEWTPPELAGRLRRALQLRRAPRWLSPFCERLYFTYPETPSLRDIEHTLAADASLIAWCAKQQEPLTVHLAAAGPEVMAPLVATFREWKLPAITTLGALAEWLCITPEELNWFADRYSWERCRTRISSRHYDYRWRRRTGHRWRLIEAPRPRLKFLQRRILHEILDHVPVHEAAHGFCTGRSCLTYAATHVGRAVVWKLDLQNFFPSLRRPRIRAIWQALGYPDEVAECLSALVTNAVPPDELDVVRRAMSPETFREWERVLTSPHLPQGAPTSPALANLAAFRLDCRLAGLAAKTGVTYTRYADDLAFSGDRQFVHVLPDFRPWVLAILLDEGFEIRERKSRTMLAHEQQRLTGLIVNAHPQSPRKAFDELRAILWNCVRFGPQSQNHQGVTDFRAHLLGRISAMGQSSPTRSVKLHRLFEQIDWSTAETVR